MKIQIDPKSAVCGLAVGIAAMFLMGSDSNSGEIGRYQISHASASPGFDVITIIDTKTGEAWAKAAGNEGMGAAKNQNFWNPK